MLWGQKYISQPQQIHMQLWTNQILVDNKSFVMVVQKYMYQPHQQIHMQLWTNQILVDNKSYVYRNTFISLNKSIMDCGQIKSQLTTNTMLQGSRNTFLSLNKSICGSGQILQPFNTVFPITLYSTVQQATIVSLLLCTVQYSRLQ